MSVCIHARDPQRKHYVLCGRSVLKAASSKNVADIDCSNCRRMLRLTPDYHKTAVDMGPDTDLVWPGWPGRCELVIVGSTGLELCGERPCRRHRSQLRQP